MENTWAEAMQCQLPVGQRRIHIEILVDIAVSVRFKQTDGKRKKRMNWQSKQTGFYLTIQIDTMLDGNLINKITL